MIPWLAALIPSAAQIAVTQPWQARPTDDVAPQANRPDNTGIIIVGVVGLALIIFLVVILSKKS
jgi:hypothetical protein